ncbi:hypothetical protein LTR85_007569 [Meristemomyces frigidus]|nr:hypothetical protein LTR85_007569 [Meristemomyces frigidus]
MPDLECGFLLTTWVPMWDCVCTNTMDGTAFAIYDSQSPANPQQRSFKTAASLGYYYDNTMRWRHVLHMGKLDPAKVAESTPDAIQAMAHELGHIIGLQHEHQRRDAGQFVDFLCHNVAGYDQVLATIGTRSDPAFTPGMTAEQRMAKVCSDYTLAGTYFPPATDYMPLINARPEDAHLEYGDIFDHRSIMIYSSWEGKDAQLANRMVLAKNPAAYPLQTPYIYLGGHSNPSFVSVSVWDIVRMAQLYPIGPDATTTDATIAAAIALSRDGAGWGMHSFVQPGLWPNFGKLIMDSINRPAPFAHPVAAARYGASGAEGDDMDTGP